MCFYLKGGRITIDAVELGESFTFHQLTSNPHIQTAFSSSLLTMGLVWNSALTLDVRAACTLLTTAEKVAARHRSSHGSTALQRGGGGSETAAGSHTTAARWSL